MGPSPGTSVAGGCLARTVAPMTAATPAADSSPTNRLFEPGSWVVLVGEVLGVQSRHGTEHAYVRVGPFLAEFDTDALPALEYLTVPRTVAETVEWLGQHGEEDPTETVRVLVERGLLWWHGLDRDADVRALSVLVVRPRGTAAADRLPWLPDAALIEVEGRKGQATLPPLPFAIWMASDGRTAAEVALAVAPAFGLEPQTALSRAATWLPRMVDSGAVLLDVKPTS